MGKNFKSKKVLIVEDEENQLFVLEKAVKEVGGKPIRAINGRDGLKVALEEKPDLILTDILITYMDGLEMVEKIREDEWGKGVEIIVLTNLSDKESQMLDSQVHTYLI